MCVTNVMPVLFLNFITLQHTAALSGRTSAADITLSDATSQTEHQFIHYITDCSAGRTEHATVLFSPLKDTKFASILGPPAYISVSKTLQQKTICCLSWKLGAAGCFAAQMTTKWGPVGVSTEHRLSSLSLMRQKWTVHMLTPLNLKHSPQPLQAGSKMAAACDR